MQKGTLAAAAALTIMALAADARAETTDGCTLLAETVYEIVAGDRDPGWRARVLPPLKMYDSVHECHQAAEAVSTGFSQAMAGMNLHITWSTPEQQRGDVCLSVDLSQCYPSRNPMVPAFSLYDAAFVVQSWQAVQSSVTPLMAGGTGNDVIRFDARSVSQRLQRQLQNGSGSRRFTD